MINSKWFFFHNRSSWSR